MSVKAIFFDKDGTLVEHHPRDADPLGMHLCSGAGAALRLLARLDYRIFIVGNEAADAVRDRLADLLFREALSLDGYCGADKLQSVAREHDLDLTASWVVGDVLNDVEAGNRAGCKTMLIDNGHETVWRLGPHRIPTWVAPDVYSAAVVIANEEGSVR
ncbi:MAG: HAD-IIIA family hydrolase [Pseudomonadota bacterium]